MERTRLAAELGASRITAFPEAHASTRIPRTPAWASWCNQSEKWFSKIQRRVIARGVRGPVADPRREIMRYVRRCDKAAAPDEWTCANPGKELNPLSRLQSAGFLTASIPPAPRLP